MKKHSLTIFIVLLVGLINVGFSQEVKINSNLVVEADGTVRMDGVATVYDDLRVTLDKGSNAASLEYFSGSTGPQIWYFRNNANLESMSFIVQLPHTWKEGSTIFPHLHWSPRASESGNVVWNFDYTWANYNPSSPVIFPATTTSTVTSTGPFTANTHLITPLTNSNSGLVSTGKLISSILICRLWRNSSNTSDTYADDAGLLFIDFHYEIDSYGSRNEYAK